MKLEKYLLEVNKEELVNVKFYDGDILADINAIETVDTITAKTENDVNDKINHTDKKTFTKNNIHNNISFYTITIYTIKDEFVGKDFEELEEELGFDLYDDFLEHISEEIEYVNNNVFPDNIRF